MNPSEKYGRRDLAILRHISLYGLALYAVLSEIFFDRKTPGNAIKKLELAGLVQSHQRALPGRLSYLRLTPAGCARLCVPKERARSLGSSAIDLAIAVECFCCLGPARSHKLEHAELRKLFQSAAPPPNVVHVVSESLGYPALCRVFQAATDIPQALKAIRDILDQFQAVPQLREWADAGDYALLVLCPTPDMQAAVRQAVDRQGLSRRMPIQVDLGPTAATLAEALRGRGKDES
jgi:DNA-binding MarR family transcriptional regulator